MALAYLEIKDFPSDVSPIVKGATQVVTWWRAGELAANERDAALVVLNALAYAAGMGIDLIAHQTMTGNNGDPEVVATCIESAVAEALPVDDGTMKAVSPLLIFQIAQLVFQLIKSLKS